MIRDNHAGFLFSPETKFFHGAGGSVEVWTTSSIRSVTDMIPDFKYKS
jgi:hypothetical protein